MKADYANMPDEVWWVHMSLMRGYVGYGTLVKMDEIIEKYPEYFPWDAAYKKIPKEVHDAFDLECYPDKYKPFEMPSFKDENNGKGLLELLKEQSPQYTVTNITFEDVMRILEQSSKESYERQLREDAEETRVKKVWDKHYKKYKLPYRETYLKQILK